MPIGGAPLTREDIPEIANQISTEIKRLEGALKDAQERVDAIENHLVERFNPPDSDLVSAEWIIDAAADYISAQSCLCTPAMVADRDPCPRCEALGMLGNEKESR